MRSVNRQVRTAAPLAIAGMGLLSLVWPANAQAPNAGNVPLDGRYSGPPPIGPAPSFPTATPQPPSSDPAPPLRPPADRTADIRRPSGPPPEVTRESTPAVNLPSSIDYEPAQIVARVGQEVIQAVDVVPAVNEIIEKRLPVDRSQVPQEEIDRAFRMLLRQRVKELVDVKLLVNDARQTIPAENFGKIDEAYGEMFDKDQLPKLLESEKVSSRAELEAKLKSSGSTFAHRRRAYAEMRLAYEWLGRQVKERTEITHEELVQYYRDHTEDFELTPEARWEQISILFENHPDKREAYRLLALLGNDLQRGAPWADVAKAKSEESAATEGGIHDWTPKGSLASEVLDEAIFSLPPGSMSRIIEDTRGFHIVRVLERKDETRRSFGQAQADIRKKIRDERRMKGRNEYVAKLRTQTPVWTIFDDMAPEPRTADSARPSAPR